MTVRRETAMPASDRLSTFIAAGAWAAIVGGAALVISFLLEWLVVPYEKLGVAEADLTASYMASSGLRLLSTVLFLWALLALYNRQSIAAGTKAANNSSYHGGSRHGGYGHGLAVDLVSLRGDTRQQRASAEGCHEPAIIYDMRP